ncbi:YoaK family protein [Streptomyces sp. NPDC059442]|uniref:YoaK family protein n=2 Tax=unclassified Streptomyces TaxID=2593676 RepID=UPI0036778FD0
MSVDPDRRIRSLTPFMAILTLTTGVVEAVSVLQLGPVFTATQTGSLLFLAFGLAGQGGLSVVAPVVSIGAFAVGAVIGARMDVRLDAHRHRWFIIALVTEGLLIALAALAGWGVVPSEGAPSARHSVVIALLALPMGIRNVTALRINIPDMPTTVVTRGMTALLSGSALGHDPALGYGSGAVRRRSASVLAMFVGGLIGAYLVRLGWSVTAVLLPVAAVVLVLAAVHSLTPPPGMKPPPEAR